MGQKRESIPIADPNLGPAKAEVFRLTALKALNFNDCPVNPIQRAKGPLRGAGALAEACGSSGPAGRIGHQGSCVNPSWPQNSETGSPLD